MVSFMSLWLPILASAVAVFFVSFVTHMVLKYHQSDYPKLANEDAVMNALRPLNIPPGDYMMPCGAGPQTMKDPVWLEKFKKGPVVVMTVMPAGEMTMGKNLIQWFIYCVIVSAIAGYVAGSALAPGQPFGAVMRFAGCGAFLAYAVGLWPDSIWYKRKWSTTFKSTFDGLLYALATGAVFAVLWPKG